MNQLSFLKNTLKFGIIMGLGFCAYTIFMWATQLDSVYLNIGKYLDMAIILLPILVIYWAIKSKMQEQNINIFQRIIIAIFVGLISFLIYDPFLYVYHHFINPTWFDAVVNLKETELKSLNTSPQIITEELAKMRTSNVAQSGLFNIGAMMASVVIIPTLIALLSLIFLRKKTN
jgi:Protein of unknown function (DUF4199)